MLYLVDQQRTGAVKEEILRIDPAYPVFVDAILDGVIQGDLYVDHRDHPCVYFAGTTTGIYYVAGRTEAALSLCSTFIVDVYKKQKRENRRFTLFSANPASDEMMKKCFGSQLNEMQRHAYSYDLTSPDLIVPDQDEMIKRTNEQVIAASKVFPSSYYEAYWGGVDHFLSNGVGVAILNGEDVVSECISIFSSEKRVEIDIWTDEACRGKGLALLAAQQLISICVEKGKTPHWDCDVHHATSAKLAEKLGFQWTKTYRLFYASR